jgi:small subunit ribosomal protein S2
VVALVDTNCDPDEADFVVPGNDDAIKSCDLVIRTIAEAIEAGKQKVKPEEFAQPAAPEAASEVEEPPAEEAPAEEPVTQAESAEESVQAEEVPAE